jgi:hypothetical protein
MSDIVGYIDGNRGGCCQSRVSLQRGQRSLFSEFVGIILLLRLEITSGSA